MKFPDRIFRNIETGEIVISRKVEGVFNLPWEQIGTIDVSLCPPVFRKDVRPDIWIGIKPRGFN